MLSVLTCLMHILTVWLQSALAILCLVEELEKYGIQDVEDTSINQNIPQNTPKKRNDRTSKVETFGKRSKFPNSPKCLEVDIFRILAVKWLFAGFEQMANFEASSLRRFVSHFTRFSRHTLNRTLTSKDVLGEYPLPCLLVKAVSNFEGNAETIQHKQTR